MKWEQKKDHKEIWFHPDWTIWIAETPISGSLPPFVAGLRFRDKEVLPAISSNTLEEMEAKILGVVKSYFDMTLKHLEASLVMRL